ncbi:MAG: RHS repeat protein [Chloroflexi bacterium]|nr:RHS repeat protein [Chloroflexota bacterium]
MGRIVRAGSEAVRALVSAGFLAVAITAIVPPPAQGLPPGGLTAGGTPGPLTADERKAGAADRFEAALAAGGSGVTFEVTQHNTLYARAGGPKIELTDPADQTKVVAQVDERYVNTILSQGSVTADAFWMEMRVSRAFDAMFAKADFLVRVQEADGKLWRDDGAGWYGTDESPGVGMDPVTARLVPTLLRSLADAQPTDPLQFDGRVLPGISGTAAKGVFPGVIAADGVGLTEATFQVESWFDAEGRLVRLQARARNLNQSTYDLISETVVTFGYGGAGKPPELTPIMSTGAMTTSRPGASVLSFAIGVVGILAFAAIGAALLSRRSATRCISFIRATASAFRRRSFIRRTAPVWLGLIVTASSMIPPAPNSGPLLLPPVVSIPTALAGYPCSSHSGEWPLFTGYLSNSSAVQLTRTTSGDVYGRISNVDRIWQPTPGCGYYRYDGIVWATTNATTNLTVDWGAMSGDGQGCTFLLNTSDLINSDSGPCGAPSPKLVATLSPEWTYQNDSALNTTGDFAFAHADCVTWYGIEPIKTNATTSVTSGEPGANCGNKQIDATTVSQTLVVDGTKPTTTFTTPVGAAGGTVYRTSTASYNVVRTITEAVAGFGGANTWKLQRQVVPLTTPNTCGTSWANDGSQVTGTTTGSVSTAQTLVDQKCYRWLADATDQNGNVMTQVTSATLVVDATVPTTTFTSPPTGSTVVLTGTSTTVSWTEAETGTGIATRSLQRRSATYAAGACGTYANDGLATSAVSPLSVSGLLDGTCYQWIQTLTDVAGNQSATTSGTARVDAASPSANFSTPDEGTTTVQTSTIYTVAWSETAGSGSITSRSLQRQSGAIVSPGTCAGVSFANDGSASTATSPVSATGLTSGNCYRWVQTLTNSSGKSGASTSGSVLVDATSPAAAIATPEVNRPIAGIVDVTGTVTDPGSFRDYTLDYGAGTTPASWTPIASGTSQVAASGVLGSFDTRALAGIYTLRLTVRDWAGNANSVVSNLVYVENSLRGEETYLERQPFDLGGGWTIDVGVANGEARLSRDLFSIPSYGPAQALSLTYSSAESTAAGRFGFGWSSNLTQFLSFESGFVVWHRADGGRVPFGNVAGTWTPPRGHFETLTSAGSEYTITAKDQTRYVFENAGTGWLKRIENRFGKALTMVWNSNSATATDASGRVSTISIHAAKDRITDLTDSAGRTWTFGYANGNTNDLVSVTDPGGKVASLAYDGSHRLTSVSRTRTPASGAAVTVTWGIGYTSGKATSVTDPVNASVSHTITYNAGSTVVGLLKEYSPLVRTTWTYALDDVGLGRPVAITDPEGFVTTKAYDADSNLIQIVRPVDAGPPIDYQTITYAYDARGNVTSETAELDAAGTVVTTVSGYNATNDILFRSEADNDSALKLITKYAYDGAGHLTSANVNCTTAGTTPPATASTCTGAGTQDASTNLISSFTYTAKDQLEDETDPLGRVTHHTYDTSGNETGVTRNYVSGQSATGDRNVVSSQGFNQATTAGKAGHATSATDPVGNVTTFTYDALGRQLTEVTPGDSSIPALTTTTTYDELGNPLTETQGWTGVTRTTTRAYDKANRETSVTDPAGVVTSTTYDAAGNAISSTGAGVTTTRTYDGLGRALTETVGGATTTHLYDPAGNERQTVDAAGVTSTRIFDRAGRLTSETVLDASGQLTSAFAYDRLGRQTGSTDPVGAVTTTTYDRPGKILTTTVDGLVSTNAYDRAGNLLSTKNPTGDVTASVVDALNRTVTSIANCTNSGTTQPAAGTVCTGAGTHDATTNVTTSTYLDAADNVLATRDPSGIAARSFPNVRNVAKSSIANCTNSGTSPPADPATCAGTGTADSKTNVTSTVTYDGAGAAITTIVAVGLAGQQATMETAFDAAGRAQASRDPAGTITRTFYDASGRTSSVVGNCTNTGATVPASGWESCAGTGTHDATWNVTTTSTYDATGNRDTETEANGRATKYVYDAANRVIERIENSTAGSPTADQNLSTFTEYDAAGRVAAVRAPTANRTTFTVTSYGYDNAGRVRAELRNCTVSGTTPPANPDWRGCRPTWNSGTSSWDILGTQDADTNLLTTYTYDDRGNRTSMKTPSPSDSVSGTATVTTSYAYDSANRLCRVLEAATTDLQSLADPCSTAVSGTATSNVSTRYTYDPAGNLASMIDGRGNTTGYAYDAAGRMTGLTDALSNTLAWSYDALGRRIGQTNRSTGSVTWTYDAAGRMLTRAATSVATVTYTYDLNGNRLTADDGSAVITTTYDRLNRPTQVTVAGDSAATTTYTYSFTSPTWTDASGSYSATIDAFGRETGLLDPIHGATSWTSAYRADGQQASLATPNGNTTAWTYDDAGRPTGSATTAAGPVTRASYTYTYNRAGQRLSEASSITGDPTNGTVTFAYDALGRLTGYSGTPITSQAYAWDKVPNRTSKQVGAGPAVTMTYDNANRPASDSAGNSYTNDLDGRLTGQIGQTLVWDALGRLTQVKDPITQANISTYTYDALDRLLTVSNGAGLTRFRYVGATTQIAQARDLTNTVLYNVGTSWAGGARMDFGPGGANQRFYGVNGHGDLTWTASSTGAVSATLRSDPWGTPGTSSGGSLPAFRFQSSWYDTSSTLSWVVTRWYAPALGRFVSEDSLLGEVDAPASRHLYAYGLGEPVGRWDPDGHVALVCGNRGCAGLKSAPVNLGVQSIFVQVIGIKFGFIPPGSTWGTLRFRNVFNGITFNKGFSGFHLGMSFTDTVIAPAGKGLWRIELISDFWLFLTPFVVDVSWLGPNHPVDWVLV